MNPALSPLVLLVAAIGLAWGTAAEAASHREAPLIALDPSADNTDVYAFVSYDTANLARPANDRRVTFILNVNPGARPERRAQLLQLRRPSALRRVNIDNDRDG